MIDRVIKNTLEKQTFRGTSELGSEAETSDEKTYVCLRLPWVGNKSLNFWNDLEAAVVKAFRNITLCAVLTQARAFLGKAKDFLPLSVKSDIVYELRCSCRLTYIGKKLQCLSEKVNQHISRKLLHVPPVTQKENSDSATTKHLKSNTARINHQLLKSIRILALAWNRSHRVGFEAIDINKKLLSPLCL